MPRRGTIKPEKRRNPNADPARSELYIFDGPAVVISGRVSSLKKKPVTAAGINPIIIKMTVIRILFWIFITAPVSSPAIR